MATVADLEKRLCSKVELLLLRLHPCLKSEAWKHFALIFFEKNERMAVMTRSYTLKSTISLQIGSTKFLLFRVQLV